MSVKQVILCVLSYNFPLVGLILFLVNRDSDDGKNYGKFALASIIVNVAITIITAILYFALFAAVLAPYMGEITAMLEEMGATMTALPILF